MMLSDVCLSVCLSAAYIGLKSRTKRPRKTRIGTEVDHITWTQDTTFKVKRSTCRGGAYCGGLPHSLLSSTVKASIDFDDYIYIILHVVRYTQQ